MLLFLSKGVFAERLPVKIYTSSDGLGSSFVDNLMKDSRGFMWFCTRDGFSRFDGSNFVTYQIGDSPTPPAVESIYQTRDGVYWVNTNAGTYRFNAETISPTSGQHSGIDAEFVSEQSGKFFEDSKGIIWTTVNGISRLEINQGKVEFRKFEIDIPPKQNRSFFTEVFAETPDGSIWFETSWGLIRKLPDDRIVYYPDDVTLEFGATSNRGGASMISDAEGRIWATFGRRIFVIRPDPPENLPKNEKLIIKSIQPTRKVTLNRAEKVVLPEKTGDIFELVNQEFVAKWSSKRMFRSSDGTVWITSESSLLKFENERVEYFDSSVGLPNVMSWMGEDTAGNLWITGVALARLDRHGLVTYTTADGLNSNRIFAINEAPDGTLYLAGRDAYLNRFNGNSFEAVRPGTTPNTLFLWSSRNALLDTNGDWWILSNEKLYRFAGVSAFSQLNAQKPAAIYNSQNGLKSDGIFQIFQDSGGDIWVSTRGPSAGTHGLSRLRRNETNFHTFTETEGFPNGKSVGSFAEDGRGDLWLGFYEGGLARFHDGVFTVFSNEEFSNGGAITDLLFDRENRLWLTSAGRGVWRIENPSDERFSISNLTTKDGLASNNVRTLVMDNFGRIYFGTVRGIDRLSPDSGLIKHFSVRDGLASDFVQDSHCDKQGNLWFATNEGLSRLVPLADVPALPPSIWIDGLRIAGVEHPISKLGNTLIEKGELSNFQNNLEVDFIGINFRPGEILRYQHKLEGADTDWSEPSELPTVSYANLQPADYRFLVRAVNSEGLVSENPAVVSFRILPPVWRRWWFILLGAILIAIVATSFYRYRMTRLEEINRALEEARQAEENLRKSREERLAELEKVRTRIATDLHDDIGASLTQIAVLSEVAQTQGRKGSGASTEPLLKITDVSNELVGKMSDIVWSINPAKDHLSDLIQRMRRFASDLLSAKEIGFQFKTPENAREITLNTNIRRDVFLIFKESVNNIVKHSDARRVLIELKIADGSLFLTITDDGKGFATAQTGSASTDSYGGNGIPNLKKRALEMQGSIEIVSEVGSGTTVKLILPIENVR